MLRELGAEFIGTFMLVSAVCGAALFSAPSAGLVAVAFAVGLSVLAMAYAVGRISGGHFNPAVTCGLIVSGHCQAGYSRAGEQKRLAPGKLCFDRHGDTSADALIGTVYFCDCPLDVGVPGGFARCGV